MTRITKNRDFRHGLKGLLRRESILYESYGSRADASRNVPTFQLKASMGCDLKFANIEKTLEVLYDNFGSR